MSEQRAEREPWAVVYAAAWHLGRALVRGTSAERDAAVAALRDAEREAVQQGADPERREQP